MAVYLIGYDLKEGADYGPLRAAIEKASTGVFWNLLDSTWIIESTLQFEPLRDRLMGFNLHEKLFVTGLDPISWTV